MSTSIKPVKPQKKIYLPAARTFYFDHVSNKVSLGFFLDWIKSNVPKSSKDVTLSIDENFDDYDGTIISCNIRVEWKVKMDNVSYDRQMKQYKKNLAKWKKQCQK